jgi:hypothetical protein
MSSMIPATRLRAAIDQDHFDLPGDDDGVVD